MNIDVFTVPAEVNEQNIRGRTVIVIDVLRASSSLLQAFANGCREVFPVESIERALSLHTALFTSDVLLCGERDGIKIDRFHLSNSPFEYTRDAVENKSLIFTSTNGSAALVNTRGSRETLICGFLNIDITAEAVRESAENLTILCAGKKNHFSLEDIVCAGMLVEKITAKQQEQHVLTDAARMAVQMFVKHSADLGGMVRISDHGQVLLNLGMERDLDFCVELNSIPLLLRFVEGKIRLD